MAFMSCVSFCGYGVMRKLGSRVVSSLSGRYWNLGSGVQL